MSFVRSFSTRFLAVGAAVALIAFPILVVTLNIIQRDQYSPVREAMSNLALGRAGWLMAVAFSALAAGSILLAVTLRRSVRRAVVAPILLTVVGLLTFVSAVFHTDADGAAATLHGEIHMAAGITTFLLLVATIAASSLSFRRSTAWRRFSLPSMIWAVVAFGTFFLVPAFPNAYFGVAQRIFVGTCLTWMVLTAGLAARKSPAGEERRPAGNVTAPPNASAV